MIKEIGRTQEARPLRRAPGRLRQPLHLRAASARSRKYYPVPKRDAGDPTTSARAIKANGDDDADPKPAAPASAGPPDRRLRQGARSARPRRPSPRTTRRRPACRSRSACSPTPTWTARARPAASSSCSTRKARKHGGYETYKNYFSRPFGLDPKKVRLRAPEEGLARDRRHDHRPHRPDRARQGAAPRLLDPPGRQGRAADRPEADPRRLEAARGHRHLPRLRPQRAATATTRTAHVDRPDPAAAQAAAREARALRRAHRGLRVRARRHPLRPDRPPRARHARLPRRVRPAADGHAPQVRPRLLHELGQRLRTTRRATRSTSRRSTASRSSATRSRAASPSRRCGA